MDVFKKQKIIFLFEILFFVLLAFFVGSATTTSPFYGDINVIDEGQFAAWANFMLHGKHMFKDMYVVYGPLYVYPVYLLFKLFSPSAFLVRIYIVCGSLIGIIFINLVMKQMQMRTLSRYMMNLGLIFLPIMTLRQSLGWICIYLLFNFIKEKKSIYAFLLGSFAAITFLVSPDIGIIALLLIFYYFLYQFTESSLKKVVLFLFSVSFGYCFIVVPFLVWATKEGWLTSYIISTFTQLRDFSRMDVPNGQSLPNVFTLMPYSTQINQWIKFIVAKDILIYYILLFHSILFTYLTSKIILKKFLENDKRLVVILLYSILLLYASIRTPDFNHLFFTLSPFLLICAYYFGRGIELLKKRTIKTSQKFSYAVLISIIFLFFFRLLYANYPQIVKIGNISSAFTSELINPQYVGHIVISDKQKKSFNDLAYFMRNNSTSHDKIFIFTDEPILYLIMNRDNATKYVLPFAAVTKTMRQDILQDLKQNQPKYIIRNKNAWYIDGISNDVRLPEVVHFIEQKYIVSKIIDGFIIYKIN